MHKSLEERIRKYISASGAEKKLLLEQMLEAEGAERSIYAFAYGELQRAALRTLADACRKKKSRESLTPIVVRDADRLIGIKDDKARKTAFVLIGECAPDECAAKLAQALASEQIRFVRPSIILALGNTSDPVKYLKNYVIEPGEDKHVKEEAESLKKALSKGMEHKEISRIILPDKCTLTSINRNALQLELAANNIAFSVNKEIRDAFDIENASVKDLRCYLDALYFVGKMGSYRQTAETLDAMGLNGALYRIEAGAFSQDKRRGIIQDISKGLAEFGYIDNPSAYSFEIRPIGDSLYAVFQDKRFEYRRQSIAASINPVAAASVMRICLPYMKENADVLDPFCGSGTMLVERGIIKKTNSLVGVDISPYAIKAAVENRKASGLKIALIKGDMLGYGGVQYDEITANMPFGIRISSHNSNITLYHKFADKLDKLLKKDGAAFLFTQEKKLLRDAICDKGFTVIKEEIFETGGLAPTLFIIKRGAKE